MNQTEPIHKPHSHLRRVSGKVLFVGGFVFRDGNSECAYDTATAKDVTCSDCGSDWLSDLFAVRFPASEF